MDTFEQAVNRLTNHERNLWARAGYPGLRDKEPDGPRQFDQSEQLKDMMKQTAP